MAASSLRASSPRNIKNVLFIAVKFKVQDNDGPPGESNPTITLYKKLTPLGADEFRKKILEKKIWLILVELFAIGLFVKLFL